MKKIPRTTAVILVSVMFAACSGGGNTADNTVSESVVQAQETEKTAEVKENDNIGNGKKVYFAGPLFNQGEKDFNLKVVQVLEEAGYDVFLPQRDGIEAALLEGKTEEELTEMIFALDEKNVKDADIIFMNIDGRAPDEGACVELGIAYAAGKRCYGFKTDTRSVESSLDINPMISGCMIKIFKNYDGDALLEDIKQYLSENEL
jgi:Nucleoside 2-deoxyribosyltransferase